MKLKNLCYHKVHASWLPIIQEAVAQMDKQYLASLSQQQNWLPGPQHIFNAFSQPKERVHYVLFGESPYPRAQSANGYAFWDNAVAELWSPSGLSKPVNKATSLRNFIKMLLISEGLLHKNDTSQVAIATIDKTCLVQTGSDLFNNMLNKGFLLLNASLVLSSLGVTKDAKAWQPFTHHLLQHLLDQKPQLIMFGNIAKRLMAMPEVEVFDRLLSEHPYNQSFLHNQQVLDFFQPLRLLRIS